ncbi:MAG: RNA-binding domain-containing protein [Pseudomonadota bacterium]
MQFTQVKLRNFGPFSNAKFEFEIGRVNVFIGNNGAGKTQMVGAMLAAIVGQPALFITPGGVGPSSVELLMEDGEAVETVSLTVTENPQSKPDVSKTTGPLTLQVLATMSEPHGQRLLVGHDHEAGITPMHFKGMEKFLPEAIVDDPLWDHLRREGLFEREVGSRGQRSIVELTAQLLARRRASFKIPLIVDEGAWHWPREFLPFIYRLLWEIANESQVILLAPIDHDFADCHIELISTAREGQSLAAFNPWFVTRRPNLKATRESRWVKGAKYAAQESRVCEFKEVKGGNPLGSIKSVVDQYAVAFLNAGLSQEGAIFWGIRDEDRAIVGVQLAPNECDELKRIVTERLHQIVPPIAPTAYRIALHPVYDGTVEINNLYVVEVRVPSVRRTLLFATGGQEVYVKTDAGKRRLSALELQQELVRRLGVDPDF